MASSSASLIANDEELVTANCPRLLSYPFWNLFIGNSALVNKFLNGKNGKPWLMVKFWDALLRGVAQVIFVNNPFSGLLIMLGFFWYNVILGLIVLLSAALGTLTAVLLRQDSGKIEAGLMTYNAVLVGSVTAALWTPLYNQPLDAQLCIFVVAGSILSVPIASGVSNIMSSFKPSIPILTIPFHIVVFVTFACLKPGVLNVTPQPDHLDKVLSQGQVENRSISVQVGQVDSDPTHIMALYSWESLKQICIGTFLGAGQVFGVMDFVFSGFVYVAILIYSPTLMLMSLLGSAINTCLGLLLTPFPNDDVFAGVWGFNGFLAGGAVALFYIINWYSLLICIFSAVFTTAIQRGFTAPPKMTNMPVFGLPYILSTILFICVSMNDEYLVRTREITYPELQRISYSRELRLRSEGLDIDKKSMDGERASPC